MRCLESILSYTYLLNAKALLAILMCQIASTPRNMFICYFSLRSSNPKCPEDAEELSTEKVSVFHRLTCLEKLRFIEHITRKKGEA